MRGRNIVFESGDYGTIIVERWEESITSKNTGKTSYIVGQQYLCWNLGSLTTLLLVKVSTVLNLTSGQWEEMFQICATCLEKKLSFIDWHNSLNLTNRVNNFNVQRVKTLCKNCLSRLQSPFDRLWNNKQHMIKYTQNFFIATFTTLRDDLAPSF